MGVASLTHLAPMRAQVAYEMFPASQPTSMRAQPTPLAAHVTLALRDSTLEYVVRALAHQANVRLVYDNTNPIFAKSVSVRVTDLLIMDALTKVLQGTGLKAQVAPGGEMIVIRAAGSGGSPGSPAVKAIGGEIDGRVIDSASGIGLRGVAVRIAGTKLATISSDSGHFVLKNVPAGEQFLTAKLFGYKPSERSVTVVDSGRISVRIAMVSVPTVLSGVVTTAVGQQARYEVGNDITVLNADSIQQIAPVSNITQMLETRVPGLAVQHTSGIPGAPSRLRLRGLSSINMSGDPILIVDGVRVYADQSTSVQPTQPNNNGAQGTGLTTGGGSSVGGFTGPSALDQLDPNSIASIEILKGPSATAIYGSDAASGVIVITTKHGRAGPTHWAFAADEGRTTLPGQWPVNFFLFGHNPQWNEAPLSQLGQCDVSVAVPCVKDSLVAFQALNNPRYSPLIGAPGKSHNASLTVSGGSGPLTYSVTGTAGTESGYLHLPAVELQRFETYHGFPAPGWMRTPDQYTTYGGNSQFTFQLGKTGGTIALTSSLFRSAQQQSSLQSDLNTLAQLYVDTTQLTAHPLFTDYYTRAQLKTTTFTNSVSLSNWAPWPWLPLVATAGLNIQNQDNNSLLPRDYIVCPIPQDGAGACGVNSSGFVGETYVSPTDTLGHFSVAQATNTSGSLTVGTTLASQRWVSTAVGLNVYTLAQSNYSAQTTGLPLGVSIPTTFLYPDGVGPAYFSASQATYGWYVQPTLNLHSRFFVSPGFRLDGGNNAGEHGGVNGGALSLFPKVDFSWVAVARSPSQPLFGALTLLRPRVAFGIAGIQPGPSEQLRLLQPIQVASPDGAGVPIDVLQVQALGNPQLHAERDRELEGGVDAEFWNQRLTVTLTSYQKTAYDAILAIPTASSVQATGGASSFFENVGTIRNTGVEATATARLLDSRRVDWSVNANLAKNQNRLVALAPGLQPIDITGNYEAGYTTRLVPGYPLFGLWAKPIVGFADANNDGRIEPSEVRVGDSTVFVGAQQPNYELTISTTLNLFNDRLSISTSVDYQNGLTQTLPNSNLAQLLDNPNLTPAEQAAISASLGDNPQTGIGVLQTVNTLRWNTLSLTYLAPQRLARLAHVPTLSLALQGSNLGLHSSYRGVDPNVNAFSAGNLTQDTGTLLPLPRVWNLRVTLGN